MVLSYFLKPGDKSVILCSIIQTVKVVKAVPNLRMTKMSGWTKAGSRDIEAMDIDANSN